MERKSLKRILAIVFAVTLLTAMSVFSSIDISAENSSQVIFVRKGGSNIKDGKTYENAVLTIPKAYTILGDDGGTIVLCGTASMATYNAPEHSGKITITSVYNGVDYRTTNAAVLTATGNFNAGGDTTFENITINQTTNMIYAGNCHNFTFGNGVTVTKGTNTRYPIIVGGHNLGSGSLLTVANCDNDYVLTINSGTWAFFRGGNHRGSGTAAYGEFTGNYAVIINGGTYNSTDSANVNSLGGMNAYTGKLYLEINGGTFNCPTYAVCRPGDIGSGAATIENYDANAFDVLIHINGGNFNSVIAPTQLYSGSLLSSNNPLNGSYTIDVAGGTFGNSAALLGNCVAGSVLMKYDSTLFGDEFFAKCYELPIRVPFSNISKYNTTNQYVNAKISTAIMNGTCAADPNVLKYNGNYYFCYSSGGVRITKSGNIGLFKQGELSVNADTGLPSYTKLNNSAIAVSSTTERDAGRASYQFWAPELVYLDSTVAGSNAGFYIYVAASMTDTDDGHRMQVYKCDSATDPMSTYTYKGQLRIPTDDIDCWAIDGTVFSYNGSMYYTWSGRTTSDCSGTRQDIYLAQLSNPWTVSSAKTLISTADYSWESHCLNPLINEGPQPIIADDGTLNIVYSASGSWTEYYCLGLLTYDGSGSILSKSNWVKDASPVFSSSSANSVYGPGHNCFVKNIDDSETWIVYHGNDLATGYSGDWFSNRVTRAQKISFVDGKPSLGTPKNADTLNTIKALNGDYCTEHIYGETITVTEPTCAATGLTRRTCLVCGSNDDTVLAKTSHTYGDGVVVTNASCTTDGVLRKTCSVCGDVSDTVIPSTGHTPGEWTVTSEPSLSESGAEEQRCLVCNEIIDTRIIPKKLYGDLDDDGAVGTSDAILMLRYINGWRVSINTEAADVNADTRVSLSDVLKLLKFVAGVSGITLGQSN